MLVDILDALKQLLVESDIIAVLCQYGTHFLCQCIQLIVALGTQHTVEHGRYPVQQRVVAYSLGDIYACDGILESGFFGVVNYLVYLLVITSDTFHKSLFIVRNSYPVEGDGIVKGVIRSEEWICFLFCSLVHISLYFHAKVQKKIGVTYWISKFNIVPASRRLNPLCMRHMYHTSC